MKDRITCFKLNWYDRGLNCVDSVLQEEITVYRNDRYMAFTELNGYGVICSCKIIHIEKCEIENFFDFLEKTCDKWESDYSEGMCDAGEWVVRMWFSSRKFKKACGTTEYPPNGRKIEKYIRSFIKAGKSTIEPNIFGCD